MDVTHIVLLSPISESRLRNTEIALWLHPLCHAKCYPPPPSTPVCMSYLMGMSYKDNPNQGLCGRFSAACRCGAGSTRAISSGSLKAVWAIKHAQSTENP